MSTEEGDDSAGEEREGGIPEGRPAGVGWVVESVRKASTESDR